jgi:IclR family pca regulon transcriptional regulator
MANDRREGVAGLEKGLAILQAFDIDNARLTASAAARISGITRASARRHLMTLTSLGFTGTDGKSYWPTPKVLRLGTAYLHSARLPRIVQPFLQRLTAATGESAFAAVLDEDELVYIARNGSSRIMNTGFVLGARTPPFLASAGMAILAALPPEDSCRLLAAYQVRPYTAHTVADKQVLRERIEHAARLGYAVSEQQLEPGVRGVAVALRDHKAQLVGALSVSMRIGSETAEDAVRRLLPALQQTASDLRPIL